MQAVLDSLRAYFDNFLNWMRTYFEKLVASPYHWMAYAAGAAALLLICVPFARLTFRSQRRDEDDSSSVTTAYPSMFGLTSLPAEPSPVQPRRAAWEFTPPAVSSTPPPVSNVTAINEALTVPCIHCGVTISSREDFCPACGYAQPVKQASIAAFPA